MRSTTRLLTLMVLVCLATVTGVPAGAATPPSAPSLTRDINPNPGYLNGNAIGGGVPFHDMFYFRGYTGDNSTSGLWRSDGTSAGTQLVRGYITAGDVGQMIEMGGRLYFAGSETDPNAPTAGSELWTSDGTEAGTVRVKDIFPGSAGSSIYLMTEHNGKLYFRAIDNYGGSGHGYELWVSDGTEAGTHLVRDVVPGPTSGNIGWLQSIGGWLWFIGGDIGAGTSGLWQTDGTEAGTRLFKQGCGPIQFGTGSPLIGGRMYFPCDGTGLWSTDGTDAGTWPLGADCLLPVSLGAQLIMGCSKDYSDQELWTSDGTAAGTHLFVDIWPGAGEAGTNSSDPREFVERNGTLFFTANTELGRELWKTDGTAAGTVMVRDIAPGATGSLRLGTGAKILTPDVVPASMPLIFLANDGSTGMELWTSDGTEAGTVSLGDIRPGSIGCGCNFFTTWKGALYFEAFGGYPGSTAGNAEVWSVDGTPGGTSQVTDIAPGEGSSDPTGFIAAGDNLYFSANTPPEYGRELWVIRGATPPTLTIGASPAQVVQGSSSTLTWSSTATDTCTASGAWAGSPPTSGTQSVSPTSTSTYTLTCTGAGGSVQRSTTVTVTPPAAPSVLSFSTSVYATKEARKAATVVISVTRSGSGSGAVGVSFDVTGGTATLGADLNGPAGGTLNWAVGDTSMKTFSYTILNDSLIEGRETVLLALSNPTGAGASLGSTASARIEIVDDECARKRAQREPACVNNP